MATWRSHPYHYQGYLWLYQPAVVWSATLDVTTTNTNGKVSGTDIVQYLHFDTEYIGDTDWIKKGMTVALGSTIGGWDYGWARVRGVTTNVTETVVMVWASVHTTANPKPGELTIATGA